VGAPFADLKVQAYSDDVEADECGAGTPSDRSNLTIAVPPDGGRVYALVSPRYADLRGGTFNLSWRLLEPAPSPGAPPVEPSPSATSSARPPKGGGGSGSGGGSGASPSPPSRWGAGHLAVLLVGASAQPASSAPGTALPVRLLELDPNRPNRSVAEVALPFQIPPDDAPSGESQVLRNVWVDAPCLLGAGSAPEGTWNYDEEGLPSLSGDGTRLLFPCYAASLGLRLSVDDDKVVAQVGAERTPDTVVTVFGWDGPPNATDPHCICSATAAVNDTGVFIAGTGGGELFHGCVISVEEGGREWVGGCSA
jgi:hypothetical protein